MDDDVCHIQRPYPPGRAWCGAYTVGLFTFLNFDHAVGEVLREGRLLVCPDCVEAVSRLLRSATPTRQDPL